MPLHRKILIAFADNIGLINYRSDLVQFKHFVFQKLKVA